MSTSHQVQRFIKGLRLRKILLRNENCFEKCPKNVNSSGGKITASHGGTDVKGLDVKYAGLALRGRAHLLRPLECVDNRLPYDLLVQDVGADMAAVQVSDFGSGPNFRQVGAALSRHVRVSFCADRDYQGGVVGHGKVL